MDPNLKFVRSKLSNKLSNSSTNQKNKAGLIKKIIVYRFALLYHKILVNAIRYPPLFIIVLSYASYKHSIFMIDFVLDNLISCNKLEESYRVKVRETLLRKHHHQRHQTFRRNLSNIIGRKSLNMLHSSTQKVNNMTHFNSMQNGLQVPNGCVADANNVSIKVDNPEVPATKPKLFRNYSQPAFPTTSRPQQTSFDRSESVQGHLVYQVSATQSPIEEETERVWVLVYK